jgi:type III pantothenate kinase
VKLLLVDAGNSRLKWALLRKPYRRGQEFAGQGVVELSALRSSVAWSRLLKRAKNPDLIYACNVAGPAIERQIRAASKRAGLAAPHFARSEVAAAGVRNGYPDPWRLGVDRWVGLIGAHHEHPEKNICLVGLGTAMTIDLLMANGQHVGGCIVPGPRLMIESLLEHTAGIRRRAGGRNATPRFDLMLGVVSRSGGRWVYLERGGSAGKSAGAGLFARDTHAGLLAGARRACAALIEYAVREGREHLGRKPRLILAGGAAAAITPLLHGSYWCEDDLVLRGLAVLASDAGAPDRIKSSRA